jgi:hypothetical protein
MIDAEPPWQEHEIHAAHKLYVFFLLASTVEDVQDILGDPEANFENLPKRIPKPYDTFRDYLLVLFSQQLLAQKPSSNTLLHLALSIS